MDFLKSKKLLLIAPHLEPYIKYPAMYVKFYFNNITVLIPIPRFSKILLQLPYFKTRFEYVRPAIESYEKTYDHYSIIAPRFFSFPIKTIQKRIGYLATRSCIKTMVNNRIDFSLIHAHCLYPWGFIGVNLKTLFNKPLVLTAHGSDVYVLPFKDKYYKAYIVYTLKRADKIITVSRSNYEILLSLGASSSKLHIIPNGYDKHLFKPIPPNKAKKKLGLSSNRHILLSVGNLVDVKGYTYIIDAMRLILKARKDILFVIVGSGPLERMLRKKVIDLGLQQNILLVGRKPHSEIPVWMNASTLFVLPSIGEGFPTVIPEALACGKPVIATKVGGIPEIISRDDIGTLVEPKDPKALASAILEALNKRWTSQEISNYARQYSWSSISKRIIRVYQEALHGYEK